MALTSAGTRLSLVAAGYIRRHSSYEWVPSLTVVKMVDFGRMAAVILPEDAELICEGCPFQGAPRMSVY